MYLKSTHCFVFSLSYSSHLQISICCCCLLLCLFWIQRGWYFVEAEEYQGNISEWMIHELEHMVFSNFAIGTIRYCSVTVFIQRMKRLRLQGKKRNFYTKYFCYPSTIHYFWFTFHEQRITHRGKIHKAIANDN